MSSCSWCSSPEREVKDPMEPRLNDLWPAAIDTVLKDEVVCSQSLVAVDESPSPAPELETLADPDAPRPTPPITDHKHAATSPDSVQSASRNSCGSSSPVVLVVSQEELSKMPTRQSEEASNNLPSASKPAVKSLPLLSKPRAAALVLVPMVYSEYGELVEEHTLRQPSKSEDLTVTQLLRIIKKAFHHHFRAKLGRIIVPQGDRQDSVLVDEFVSKDRLTSWDFKAGAPTSETPEEPSITDSVPVYRGPPHVLEIGCSDGAWCLNFKRDYPEWIVEGVDDTGHWRCIDHNFDLCDFMDPGLQISSNIDDYFGNVRSSQLLYPEFTTRDINQLINHPNPIKHNVYEFIRGREIFDRVESYKQFLDDIRLILKPDGVVEFMEIDSRPRSIIVDSRNRDDDDRAHKSCAQTNWTDNIEDRFKDQYDEELAHTVPGWSARVTERLKATMRPQDGVPAPRLKSWLEGAGFWDVKSLVVPVPVGGDSGPGQRLKEYILYQLSIEDEIPKLKAELPKPELDAIESGMYHINIHIVSGRKPQTLRSGDLLLNGERKDMTESSYDTMARNKAMKTSHWKRFELDGHLTTMFKNLNLLPGAPVPSKVSRSSTGSSIYRGSAQEHGLSRLIGRCEEKNEDKLGRNESPFNAPPFVTIEEMESHRAESGTSPRSDLSRSRTSILDNLRDHA